MKNATCIIQENTAVFYGDSSKMKHWTQIRLLRINIIAHKTNLFLTNKLRITIIQINS